MWFLRLISNCELEIRTLKIRSFKRILSPTGSYLWEAKEGEVSCWNSPVSLYVARYRRCLVVEILLVALYYCPISHFAKRKTKFSANFSSSENIGVRDDPQIHLETYSSATTDDLREHRFLLGREEAAAEEQQRDFTVRRSSFSDLSQITR